MIIKDKRLDQILNKISGIFDFAYEEADDDEGRDYINSIENELYDWLHDEGYIEREVKQ